MSDSNWLENQLNAAGKDERRHRKSQGHSRHMDSELVAGLKLKEQKASMDGRRPLSGAARPYRSLHEMLSGSHGMLSGSHDTSLLAQQMLAERNIQLDAEERDFWQPFVRQREQNVLRSPGTPFTPAPYLWQGFNGKNSGNSLFGSPHQPCQPSERAVALQLPHLDVTDFLDTAVERYSDWQQSRVRREDQKKEIQRVCDVVLHHGLDLHQVFHDQNPGLFTDKGIKIGIARRFIRDIGYWIQQQIGAEKGITCI
jgi:hypothetical protein